MVWLFYFLGHGTTQVQVVVGGPDHVGCEAIPFRTWGRIGIKKQSTHIFYSQVMLVDAGEWSLEGWNRGVAQWTSMS